MRGANTMSTSPAERVEIACSMSENLRDIVRAGIVVRYGAEGVEHMRKYLFLALYGQDFDEEKKRRILASWGEA